MKLALILTCLFLSSCGPDPIYSEQNGPNGVQADLITEVEGCRIWRINAGRSVYFAKCGEKAVGAQWSETHSTGKSSYTKHFQTLGEDAQ